MSRALLIAEAGVNHNGDLGLAKRLVGAAANAGADYVKFQTFCADRLVTATAAKAEYQARTTTAGESQRDMLRRLELTPEMHETLMARSAECGIGFLSSAFDLESVDYLIQLGIDFLKVPSGEITNLPYLRRIAKHGSPILLSTGMSTMEEIREALEALHAAGTPRERVTVLQCNTEYPTPMPDVNLRAMLAIRDEFGVSIGYSDHTPGIEVAIAAVALGASVIEKHFTLDRTLVGPDHAASLEPDELRAMVSAIRNVEAALGDGIKRPSPSEVKNISAARKSVVAARAIEAGEILSEHNLTVKRPGTGISPMRWDDLIGRKSKRNFLPDEHIEL